MEGGLYVDGPARGSFSDDSGEASLIKNSSLNLLAAVFTKYVSTTDWRGPTMGLRTFHPVKVDLEGARLILAHIFLVICAAKYV